MATFPCRRVALAIVIGCAGEACWAQPIQWASQSGGNGHYYEVIHNPQFCWNQARADALSRGGDLVSIVSLAEQQFVESVLALRNPPSGTQFINLIEVTPRVYAWANGEPMTYAHWFPGEPNDALGGLESVGSILWTQGQPGNGRSGFWNDVADCLFGRREYIGDYGPGGYIIEYPCTPAVTSQPASRTTCSDSIQSFSIVVGTAAGSGPFTYGWQVEVGPGNWQGLGNDPLPLPCGGFVLGGPMNAPTTNLGVRDCTGDFHFRCVVTNACGATASEPATLSVCACLACPADFNQDGGIDGADVDAFFAKWGEGSCDADTNQDGGVDGSDVDAFFAAWQAGGC